MIKDQLSIVSSINSGALEIEKALDTLSEFKYLTHIFYTIHDNLYSGKFYTEVENKSDFIRGSKETLDLIAETIYLINQNSKEKNNFDN